MPPRLRFGSLPLATAGVLLLALAGLVAACRSGRPPAAREPAAEIGVYSGRHYNTDKELYRRFTEQTGIRVKLLEGKDDALIERLRSEGKDSPADVLVLVDAARLDKAASQGLFRPVRSPALREAVPENLRDAQGRWFALTRRVRLAVVNPERVDPATIRTYADLADPALRGKLCLRNHKSVYNQSLVADQLILRGTDATREWVKGMVANLGQPLFSSDIPLTRAVARGECGVALVNSYYVARMLSGRTGDADRRLAEGLKVVFPDPAHVNVSGAGVTAASDAPEAATRLIEFLASPSGGEGYAAANHEYPLRGFGNSEILRRFGSFRDDGVSAQQMGARNREAVQLMLANGWS
ncbi:MAG: extracellular solute-binding protein [Synechococcaceae cyanobacterium]|nr:extracellular solute-binding protein [Synechococcaceae cyanobacterium]